MQYTKRVLMLLALSLFFSSLKAEEDKPISYDKLEFISNTSWMMISSRETNSDTYYNMEQVYKIVFDDSHNVATLFFENSETVLKIYIGKINPKQKMRDLLETIAGD